MISRACLVWLGILAVAFANGAVREMWLVPRLGESTAHALSVGILSTAILVVSWSTITWMRPGSVTDSWTIGIVWLALTLAFEFLAGHYVFGAPWSRLWAEYDLLNGRIWIVVLITTVAAPAAAARTRAHLPA
jgi:hypothetical protein